jgi:hypothetical protein
MTVMALMALMTVLAAGMVAVYTSSLNHVQAFSNGEIAQAEADSAINELIARLNENPSYGSSGEEIRGTRSANLSDSEAYHVLTFSGGGYPISTNANTGSKAGSLGRTVPAGHVHAVATGYCRGQYRTVEVLIAHPPFPYGLASSGKIDSKTPLTVKGRSASGSDDRPGHLVSNSPGGVTIGEADGAETYITGFVKSKGTISIDQPAVVLEGVYPGAGAIELPDIPLDSKFDNEGDPGVIEILDAEFPAQVLDVMYHSNHSVTYNGSVEMKNAFLFSREDVTIYGGLHGTGAIVAMGNVTINGGTDLSGTNNVAILAGGRITLSGGGNYFKGIVYAEGGIDARKITIVGNAITNNPADPESCSVNLDEATLISDTSSSTIEFTAESHQEATRQRTAGRVPFQIDPFDGGGEFPRGDREGEAIGATDTDKSYDDLRGQVRGNLEGLWSEDGPPSGIAWNDEFISHTMDDGAGAVAREFREAFDILEEAQVLQVQLAALEAVEDDPLTPGDESNGAERAQLALEIAALKVDYQAAMTEAEDAYMEYVRASASSDGSYIDNGFIEANVFKDYKFDLNEYLPPAERYRIGFYNVHGRRM